LRKFEKKFIVVLVSLTFLTSGVIVASATDVETSEINTLTETVTVYRHGLDGSETPMDVVLTYQEGEDLEDILLEKCEELLEKDVELREAASNSSFGALSKVKSKGKGFHYQTVLFGKLLIKFVLFRLGLPRIRTILRKPLIFCKYPKDMKANTTITPIILNTVFKTSQVRYADGPHQVIVLNFVGYTTWFRRVSFTPFNLTPRSFAGFANVVICSAV
jgi:hypothetical protein